jgi:hypothetical protein
MRSASIDATVGAFAAPGAFNDPDALLAGTGFLSPLEQRAQLSLWSVLALAAAAPGWESVNLRTVGLGPGPHWIRDVRAHRSRATAGGLTFSLAPHSAVLLRVYG